MKKLSIVLLTILMVFTFASCNPDSGKPEKPTEAEMQLLTRIESAVSAAMEKEKINMKSSADGKTGDIEFVEKYSDSETNITIIEASGHGVRNDNESTLEQSYTVIDDIDGTQHTMYVKETANIDDSNMTIVIKLDGKLLAM